MFFVAMRIGVVAAVPVVAALVALAACETFTATETPADAGADAGSSDGAALSPYAASVLDDRPILYYRLGESAGSMLAGDRSVSARNASVRAGTTAGVPGAIVNDPDTAYRFDGKTGAVVLAAGPTFTGTLPYSIEAWVRPTSFVGGRVFAACQASPNGGWAMFFNDDAKPHLEREVAGGNDGIVGAPLTGTGFAHIVGTFDGTTQRLYVDGVLIATGQGNVQNAGMFGVPFVIGANGIDAQINHFEGDIDEVAIYDHALPDERVRQHHEIGSGLGP